MAGMVNAAAAAEFLRTAGWLSKTPDAFRKAVIDRCHLRKFARGETVYSVGDPSSGIYGIGRGLVGVEITPEERVSRLAYMIGPGAWIGLRGVVTGGPRIVTIEARQQTELLFLSAPAIDEIVGEMRGSWRHFARMELGDVKLLTTLCDDLVRRDHAERLIAVLLQFAGCRLAAPGHVRRVEIMTSQDELAQAANVGRTAAGAVLRELEIAGEIELSYRRIKILAPDSLRSRLTDTVRAVVDAA